MRNSIATPTTLHVWRPAEVAMAEGERRRLVDKKGQLRDIIPPACLATFSVLFETDCVEANT